MSASNGASAGNSPKRILIVVEYDETSDDEKPIATADRISFTATRDGWLIASGTIPPQQMVSENEALAAHVLGAVSNVLDEINPDAPTRGRSA